MRTCSLLLVFLFIQPASAEVENYLLVFASDAVPYRPTRAHTYAAVVQIERQPGYPPKLLHLASLSWLPKNKIIRAFAPAETGRNVPLHETIQTSLREQRIVHMWGPYRIRPELADKFRERQATVESSFQYRGACFLSKRKICDCVRSIEEMITEKRRFIGVFGYGAASSSVVVKKAVPWIIHPQQSHAWVATMIGLDRYPINRRAFGDFTSKWDQMKSACCFRGR